MIKSRGSAFDSYLSNLQLLEDNIKSLYLRLSSLEYKSQSVLISDFDPKSKSINKLGHYVGQWNKDTGKREGLGLLLWEDGSLFEGFWKDGKACGSGHLLYSDGDVYEGQWLNGKNHGFGEYYHHIDGATYTGTWFDDTQTGKGQERWPDGAVFTGEYLNGKKHGEGSF
jgi:hypothetical protein